MKNKILSVRLSDDDYNDLITRCYDADSTTSNFVRHAITNVPIVRIDGLQEMAYQTLKIGNNINQIIKLLHTGIYPATDKIERVANDISQIKYQLLILSEKEC